MTDPRINQLTPNAQIWGIAKEHAGVKVKDIDIERHYGIDGIALGLIASAQIKVSPSVKIVGKPVHDITTTDIAHNADPDIKWTVFVDDRAEKISYSLADACKHADRRIEA